MPGFTRKHWPLGPRMSTVELLVVLAFVAVLAMIGFGGRALWRSMEHHRATADETLRDHAAYIAISYRNSYQNQTWFAARAMLEVAQEAAVTPGRETAASMLGRAILRMVSPDNPAPAPRQFFQRSGDSWVPLSSDGVVDDALRRTLDAYIGSQSPQLGNYLLLPVNRAGAPSLAFIEPRRDGTGWVGFEVETAEFAARVLEPLPQQTAGMLARTADSVRAAVGRPVGGNQLYRTTVKLDSTVLLEFGEPIENGWSGEALGGGTSFPAMVTVTLGPDAALFLMPGGYPAAPGRSVAAFIVLALTLTAAVAWMVWRVLALARLRQEFTSAVSHELRTPLANIHLYAETLLHERATDPVSRRTALETITRETRRLGDMVENVLSLARMARAEERIEPRSEDLGRLAVEAVDAFAPRLSSRSMRVESEHVGPDIAWIDGDALRRILVNLLDNAIRHGPDGQLIRMVVDNQNDAVVVIVEDEGPGIPVVERERIWEPYARGRNGGSVLGLTVVRHLARLHGGDAIASEGTVGARIEVRLATGETG